MPESERLIAHFERLLVDALGGERDSRSPTELGGGGSGTIQYDPLTTRTVTIDESRLLNRELSWVEFNARVLDLAADDDAAAARARQVLLDLLVQPRRVLHGARRRPDGPGGGRLRACARPTA